MKKNVLTFGRVFGLCLLVTAVIVLAGCQAKPDTVAMKLAEAVNAQDLDSALALFAEDAVVNTGGPAPYTGKAEIRGWLEGMFADNFEIEAEIVEVKGDVVIEHDKMSMDSMRFFGIDSLEGTSEITVQKGQITALDFTFTEDSLAKLQAVPFVTREDLIGAWSMGGTFIQFYENGTSRVADSPDDLSAPVDESHPGAWERWSYDGTVFTIQMTTPGVGEGRTCPLDAVGTYMVKRVGDDRLKFKAIEDPCASRRVGLPWGEWRPYSP